MTRKKERQSLGLLAPVPDVANERRSGFAKISFRSLKKVIKGKKRGTVGSILVQPEAKHTDYNVCLATTSTLTLTQRQTHSMALQR